MDNMDTWIWSLVDLCLIAMILILKPVRMWSASEFLQGVYELLHRNKAMHFHQDRRRPQRCNVFSRMQYDKQTLCLMVSWCSKYKYNIHLHLETHVILLLGQQWKQFVPLRAETTDPRSCHFMLTTAAILLVPRMSSGGSLSSWVKLVHASNHSVWRPFQPVRAHSVSTDVKFCRKAAIFCSPRPPYWWYPKCHRGESVVSWVR